MKRHDNGGGTLASSRTEDCASHDALQKPDKEDSTSRDDDSSTGDSILPEPEKASFGRWAPLLRILQRSRPRPPPLIQAVTTEGTRQHSVDSTLGYCVYGTETSGREDAANGPLQLSWSNNSNNNNNAPANDTFWEGIAPDLVSVLCTGRDMNDAYESDEQDESDCHSDAIALLYGYSVEATIPDDTLSTSTLNTCLEELLHLVYENNVHDVALLHSLAYLQWELRQRYRGDMNDGASISGQEDASALVLPTMVPRVVAHDDTDPQQDRMDAWYDAPKQRPSRRHQDAVQSLATFLVDPAHSCFAKLASLSALITTIMAQPHATVEDDNNNREAWLRQCFAFCVAPSADHVPWCGGCRSDRASSNGQDVDHGAHALGVLLWELRAVCLYLPIAADHENNDPCDGVSRRASLAPPHSHWSWRLWTPRKVHQQRRWERIKEYLYATDSVVLGDLDLLRDAFEMGGIDNAVILASIGHLRITTTIATTAITTLNHDKHQQAVRHVVTYLMDCTVSPLAKMNCLQYLGVARCGTSKADNKEAAVHDLLEQSLKFCTDPKADTTLFLLDTGQEDPVLFLLWELRAIGLYLWQQQEARHDRIRYRVRQFSNGIVAGAWAVEAGLQRTAAVAVAVAGMTAGSRFMVRHTAPNPSPSPWLDRDCKSAVVTLTYSNALKRVTTQSRVTLTAAVSTVASVSARQILALGRQLGQWIRPRHPGHNVAVQATGEVALATLGAAAVIGEAVVDCTGTLIEGAATATHIVVSHKYGPVAGQVVQDVGESARNLIHIERSVGLITGQNTSQAVKMVVRQTGKARAQEQNPELSSPLVSPIDSMNIQ
jgi:Senescence-associated protein